MVASTKLFIFLSFNATPLFTLVSSCASSDVFEEWRKTAKSFLNKQKIKSNRGKFNLKWNNFNILIMIDFTPLFPHDTFKSHCTTSKRRCDIWFLVFLSHAYTQTRVWNTIFTLQCTHNRAYITWSNYQNLLFLVFSATYRVHDILMNDTTFPRTSYATRLQTIIKIKSKKKKKNRTREKNWLRFSNHHHSTVLSAHNGFINGIFTYIWSI